MFWVTPGHQRQYFFKTFLISYNYIEDAVTITELLAREFR